jgi:large subunit ribosomal protein L11
MSKPNNKKIAGSIKLQIPGGKATPSPPVGPALGQKGLNIMEFCKAFNEKTKDMLGVTIRVGITAYADRTYTVEYKGPPTTDLIKKATNIAKGSATPGRSKGGVITRDQIRLVAEQKMQLGLSARTIEAAMKIVEGCARSMGLTIDGGSNG